MKLLWLLLPLGAKRFCTDSPSWMRNREPHIKQIPMEKQQQPQQPGFLEEVRKLNGEVELSDALRLSLNEIDRLDVAQLKRIGLKTYQEGKWSVHKILQHLNDWERIWCYRAVLFARKEGSVPVGHDQELMGLHSNADDLSIDHLLAELRFTRQSTIMMFDSFTEDMLQTSCQFFEYEMPLDMLGFAITAHQIHHFQVIKARYFPLAD